MSRLALLSTGGTIATTTTESGRSVSVGARELLRSAVAVSHVPELTVDTHDVNDVVSFAATTEDALALARSVRKTSENTDGVVVTHGTDTMEEVSFLVALTHSGEVPVVFTGAQRPFDDPVPDGPRNLSAALRWASSSEARGTGVSVVFDDTVLPAVGVRKIDTLALSAFAAPGRSTVATIDEAGVRAYARPLPVPPLLSPDTEELPRVDVVSQYLGVDASTVHAAVRTGARGLVLAGFGAGNTTPKTTEACLELLGEGIPIALTSRVGAGAVAGLYTDGGADLVRAGAIPAGDLSPWQAPDTATLCRSWLRAVGSVAR